MDATGVNRVLEPNNITFGIRHLLFLLTAIALATVSLVFATPLWGAVWFSVSMAVLLAATALSIVVSGHRKAFWVGVTIFGWGYWLILHSSFLSMSASSYPNAPLLGINVGRSNWRLASDDPPLWSSRMLTWIYNVPLSAIHEQPTFDVNGVQPNDSRYPDGVSFMRVGHSLFALVVALLGGTTVSLLSKRAGWSDSTTPPEVVRSAAAD